MTPRPPIPDPVFPVSGLLSPAGPSYTVVTGVFKLLLLSYVPDLKEMKNSDEARGVSFL